MISCVPNLESFTEWALIQVFQPSLLSHRYAAPNANGRMRQLPSCPTVIKGVVDLPLALERIVVGVNSCVAGRCWNRARTADHE